MAKKPNEGANSQSSLLDAQDLQKLVGDSGNTVEPPFATTSP